MKAKHHLLGALAFSGAFLAIAAGLKYAAAIDLIAPDVAVRATQAIIGLALATYANFMPKNIGEASARVTAATHAVLRVGGWSFLIAGVAYAAIWLFAPLDLADVLSVPVVIAAIVVTLAHTAWVVVPCMRRRGSSAS